MARKRPQQNGLSLFGRLERRRRRVLILPRFLADEASKAALRGAGMDAAHEKLIHWADLEAKGQLARKETALDASFLHEIFGVLGYRTATEGGGEWELERSFEVPGVGFADGALGNLRPGDFSDVVAVIELKGAATDLDRDKFNGRTPVQQCWDYLNALPKCPWGIVSNFVTTRLYHRDRTPLAYEEFHLRDLRKPERFRQFYCLFEIAGLLRGVLGQPPRALQLLARTETRQREVGDELYDTYSDNRLDLINHITAKHGKSLESAVHIAQKVLDRIIFIAFCEDRGLLPHKCLESAYRDLPPFTKVVNPRWRNFLDLFHAIDVGHNKLCLEDGYDGGLFRHDPEVDDLQLDDTWTEFFRTIGNYDFRDEVNVDVLGHLFERSVTELERLRVGGLFRSPGEPVPTSHGEPVMPKSAERKRFGIYYTPPAFTRFLVTAAVGAVIDQHFAELQRTHGLDDSQLHSDEPPPQTAEFWRDCLEALTTIKVCDPACGSGAFLIQAYDLLEERYTAACDRLALHDPDTATDWADRIPDLILSHNLYGVDLSSEAVEITQLALWIRSARPGRTLADLSANILSGNSLVTDPNVDARAFRWRERFPDVFQRPQAGFDCVVGNPPWERLKLQEREFFALTRPDIAGAVSAATRRRLIRELATQDPPVHERYTAAQARADRVLTHVRTSNDFPLTGRGDINTYMLFAELARRIVSPRGRVGLLVPSGIATDNTTRDFFKALLDRDSLVLLYDFENRKRIFPDVDGRFKFSTLVFAGDDTRCDSADFVFFAHSMRDLAVPSRHISLSRRDLALLNPNTRTCPIFRDRRDAELTKDIYRRVPILVDENRHEGGNPWAVRFVRMFDQTNDAELFHDPARLEQGGFRRDGNRWVKGRRIFIPLYEAKMVQAYDHRAASVVVARRNWVRQGQTEATTLVDHQNPEFSVEPRWWVDQDEVGARLGDHSERPAYLCYKDVTSATNQRTMIAALVPQVGMVNSAPLVLTGPDISPRLTCCLLANLNSFAFDFIARQKVGGVHLNFFIVKQLPIFPPDKYDERCPWSTRTRLEKWISDRVLKLTCTANDMRPLAEAAGLEPPVHKWKPDERSKLLAELDAAYFLLYGMAREEIEYILSTFQGLRRRERTTPELFEADNVVLSAYEELASRLSL